MKLSKILFSSILILVLNTSFSQSFDKGQSSSDRKNFLSTISISPNFGSMLFYGDVRQYDWYPVMQYHSEWKWGGGLILNKSFNYVFGFGGQLLMGNLAGTNRGIPDDTTKPGENLYKNGIYFKANVIETSLFGTININNLVFPKTTKERKIYSYAFFGVGLTNFRTIQYSLWTNKYKKSYGYSDEGTKKTEMTTETVFPVGFGIKYKMNPSLDIYLETSLRFVNTDKLDAEVIDGSTKDKYQYTCFGITYKFSSIFLKDKEPYEWRSPYYEIVKDNELIKQKIMLLSRDTDYDGVVDYFDKEPDTPEGAIVDFNGRTIDSDSDKVPDYLDNEIFSRKDAVVDSTGVEIDTDKDGVSNSYDLEPNTPPQTLTNFRGQTISPQYKAEGITTTLSSASCILPSIFFDYNSAEITKLDNIERLATIALLMRSFPELKLKIIGYADKVGGIGPYNLNLSKKRAENVAQHLTEKYKISPNRFVVDPRGSTDYLSTDDYINRRVDFEIIE